MKAFHCGACGNRTLFEDAKCSSCGVMLGFIPELASMHAFASSSSAEFDTVPPSPIRYKPCLNYADEHICNWMLPADTLERFCRSCRLTRFIPDIRTAQRHRYWAKLETAKRRLIYTLDLLGLPIESRSDNPDGGLEFSFLESRPDRNVVTGHYRGTITVNISEADDIRRERVRVAMGEPYRTLLGHLRHEAGHYYFEKLVATPADIAEFRQLFGDERTDYQQSLKRHYAKSARPDWSDDYVSAYATMHPWEDWAESWAHYLRMFDAVDTAIACGLSIDTPESVELQASGGAPNKSGSFRSLMLRWPALAYATNNLNRSLGLPDAYPFVIKPKVAQKLEFVHRMIALAPQS